MTKSCVIIGLGQIGMGYDYDLIDNNFIYTHSKAIFKHPNFNLVGAVEKSQNKRKLFEKKYKVSTFDNTETAIEKLKPDLVIISTPTETHNKILDEVLNTFRPKLILCEKPLAYDLETSKNMIEKCQRNEIELLVNYIRRVDKGVLEIKRLINEHIIKTPVKVNVWYSKGLINNGSHFIDLLSLWLGEINKVKIINSDNFINNKDFEPEFEINFNLGTAIFRSAWEDFFSHYTIEILSKSGRLFYDNGGANIEWKVISPDPNLKGHNILGKEKKIIDNSMDFYQWHVYDHIHKYLNGEVTTLCTGLEAIKTQESIDILTNQN